MACSSGRGAVATTGEEPGEVRPAVASLPENPCELLTADQVAAATGLRVTRAHRVPDIGEIIRAEKEGRTAHANTICSYDTPSEYVNIAIIIPPVGEQNSAAYRSEHEDYLRQSHAESIGGLGDDAWLAGGTTLHVLAGKSAQFIVATRMVDGGSRDVVVAVAKAVLSRFNR